MSDNISIGSERVRAAFNPSGNDMVTILKEQTAVLIDHCEALKRLDGRLASLAQTAYEEACMWAVKAATTQPNGFPVRNPDNFHITQSVDDQDFHDVWIDVTERLPMPNQVVLVLGENYEGTRPFTARYYEVEKQIDWFSNTDRAPISNVTHWMPVPSISSHRIRIKKDE
jgi:hypothetical protein